MATLIRKRISIRGVVQGVGFRPFVWQRASRLGLVGWVENDTTGVTAEIQGPAASIATFLEGFETAVPPLASVEHWQVSDVPVDPAARPPFMILPSVFREGAATALPADVGSCPACLAELRDEQGRRFRYPFTNCTACGPRLTIITGLPYDRSRTTMRGFPPCADCAAEYADPRDRRFHAEPIACPKCGPEVWLVGNEHGGHRVTKSGAAFVGDAAVRHVRLLLRQGRIIALKGLGGFHLVCDATNGRAVALLRERKGRVGKPLAVMVSDVAAAHMLAHVDTQERRLLESRERPIVLVRKRHDTTVSDEVSPGTGLLGIMLPYSPLHHLICEDLPPLVMTSGNLSEEPIVHENQAAVDRLGHLADALLLHDRPIEVACDDSVVRCVAGGVMPLRRSRGHAPLPIPLTTSGPAVLAVGGELKATVCVAHDCQAVMSQHIGDMENLATLDSLARTVDHLLRLFGVQPDVVAADMHPGYLSTGWARAFARDLGVPLVQVQHHEAHVAALLAEHGAPLEDTIAVCFDGTGYGRDGTIWGGEWFVASGGTLVRAAHLAPFSLPGGDASIRHPWRAALAVLQAAGVPWDDRLPPVRAAAGAARVLARQLTGNLNCTATSSMGRLFDAVAALAGVCQSVSYEAEAALALEALVPPGGPRHAAYAFTIEDHVPLLIGWQGVVRAIAADLLGGSPPAEISYRFHRGVANMIVDVCRRLRSRCSAAVVGLTGGVFQNAVLVQLALESLHDSGFEVFCHQRVPANDGGLALGQAVLARRAVLVGRTSPGA